MALCPPAVSCEQAAIRAMTPRNRRNVIRFIANPLTCGAKDRISGQKKAGEGGLTVALELELTPELRREGLTRELVRVVQEARKAAGLDVSDRIVLGLNVDGELGVAVETFLDWIAAETLAVELVSGAVPNATYDKPFAFDQARGRVSLRRV